MGPGFIAALLLRLQALVSDRLHGSAFRLIVDAPDIIVDGRLLLSAPRPA
jgi:hypothetical protein